MIGFANKTNWKMLTTNFYKNIFSNDSPFIPLYVRDLFTRLEGEDIHNLSKDVSMEELFHIVKIIDPFKALGPDGLHAIFITPSGIQLAGRCRKKTSRYSLLKLTNLFVNFQSSSIFDFSSRNVLSYSPT